MRTTDTEDTRILDGAPSSATFSTMVLLVDDQPIVAQSVRRLLADRPNIDLHYCSDSATAIRMANEVRPTVILQDWMMPSIDGLRFAPTVSQQSVDS